MREWGKREMEREREEERERKRNKKRERREKRFFVTISLLRRLFLSALRSGARSHP